MSRTIDIYIGREEVMVGWHRGEGYHKVNIPSSKDRFAASLAEIAAQPEAPREVVLYLAEDLLFFSQFELDRQTPDLEEAIAMQLELLSPYGEDSVYAFSSQRQKESYQINYYVGNLAFVEPYLNQIHGLDLRLAGLFPEGQRYLTKDTRKEEWGLWVEGRFGKLLHFKEGRLEERLQSPVRLGADELKRRSGLETIYALEETEGFADSRPILAEDAAGQEFDMLPPSFRQPDYLRGVIMGLVAINLLLLLLVGSVKMVALSREANLLEREVQRLAPQVAEIVKLKEEEEGLAEEVANFQGLEANIDLIDFMAQLSKGLPKSAYLDQLRVDKKKKTIHLQGYSDDLGKLTSALQKLGNATLKSSRKRRNQTYFHVEVSQP
ncbi:MAG: hypothetical protein ABFR97_09845 [Thermodesulfobacteriota bacterium]